MSQSEPTISCADLVQLSIDVEKQYTAKIDPDLLETVICRALRNEGWDEPAAVSMTITSDEGIQLLNREYRGIDAPTDVLSFSQLEGDEFPILPGSTAALLGDIVVSFPRVEQQATEYGHSTKRELAYLTVHGLLHLLGYDHQTDEDRAVMRQKEEDALPDLSRG